MALTDDLIDDLIQRNTPKPEKLLKGDWSKLRPSNGDAERHTLVEACPMRADTSIAHVRQRVVEEILRREQRRIFDELMELEMGLGTGG